MIVVVQWITILTFHHFCLEIFFFGIPISLNHAADLIWFYRISRLKKVANHEANKIKFDGLEKEREEISLVIREATKAMSSGAKLNKSVTEHIDNLKVRTLMTQVAGRTGAYVDSLLDDQPWEEMLHLKASMIENWYYDQTVTPLKLQLINLCAASDTPP